MVLILKVVFNRNIIIHYIHLPCFIRRNAFTSLKYSDDFPLFIKLLIHFFLIPFVILRFEMYQGEY